jgi:hypothetical protein
MNRTCKLAIWAVFYGILLSYVFFQYAATQGGFVTVDAHLIYAIVSRPQKLYLNVVITWSLLHWVNRTEFLQPIIRIRYASRLFPKLLLKGLLGSFSYTIYTFLLVCFGGLRLGSAFSYTVIPELLFVTTAVFQFYCVGTILYVLLKGNYVMALACTCMIYLTCSTLLISLDFFGVDTSSIYDLLHSTAAQSFLDAVLFGGLYALVHEKDSM